eukprot:447928-Prymnesium_polylepis.1
MPVNPHEGRPSFAKRKSESFEVKPGTRSRSASRAAPDEDDAKKTTTMMTSRLARMWTAKVVDDVYARMNRNSVLSK